MNIQQKLDSQLNEVLELFNKNLMDACLSRINRIIKSNKKQFLPYNYRGIIFLSLGKNAEALDDFKKALALNSSFPEGYNNLALAYRALKKPELALLAYKKSLALNPNSIEARMNLATLYAELNLFMQSIEEYKLVIKTNPSHEHAYQLLADILLKIQKYDDAISYHKKACELNPQNFMNYYLMGADFLWIGKRLEAAKNFRKAINLNPRYCQSYYGLSRSENLNFKDPLFEQAKNLLEGERLPPQEQVYLNFFLAKFYEDNDPHLFFNYLNIGCEIQRKISSFNIVSSRTIITNSKNIYQSHLHRLKELLAKSNHTPHTICPIFIVGMPRSGTSLIEQILSNHSEVFGAGELDLMHTSMETIFSQNFREDNFVQQLVDLRSNYTNFIKILTNKSYVTDKLPLNFHWLGFIKLIFPNAKFIHTHRDPIATSFSIYKTLFSAGSLNFSYSFDDIIDYYEIYESTIKFWDQEIPMDIMNIHYESFVLDPQTHTHDLCKFINLSFQEHMMDISLNKRPVLTASDSQVREKIYSGSSEAWKKYSNYLQPLIDRFNR